MLSVWTNRNKNRWKERVEHTNCFTVKNLHWRFRAGIRLTDRGQIAPGSIFEAFQLLQAINVVSLVTAEPDSASYPCRDASSGAGSILCELEGAVGKPFGHLTTDLYKKTRETF